MGHPRLKKKTYSKPTHPWQKERIEEEKELLREFGLKNKTEVWRVSSLLRKYAGQAKKLIPLNTPQSEIEKAQLLKKLSSLGLIEETAKLEDVLTITLKDILDRRLQTIVYKKNLAKSLRQARQFITHEHILVGDRKITSPSYFVTKKEEASISFTTGSSLFNQDHPERSQQPTEAKPKEKTPKKEEPKEKKTKDKETKKEEKKEQKEKTPKKEEPKEKKTKDKETKKEEKKETATKKEEKPKEEKKEQK